MKNKLLKIIALLLAVGMVFAMAACKKQGDGNGASSSGSGVTGDEGGKTDEAGHIVWSSSVDLGSIEDFADEKGSFITPHYNMRDKTVSFLSHWSAETPDSVHMIAYMEKYGGPNIKFLTYNYGDCGMKLQAMVLAENAPDVYKLRIGDLTSLLFANVWSDVTDKFDWEGAGSF